MYVSIDMYGVHDTYISQDISVRDICTYLNTLNLRPASQ
jgi:hypothetical protein